MSGGQSGVDRAALDAARAAGLAIGGWCPRGRWAEDGPIPPGYPLRETPERDPAQRTTWNVRDSDATLILARRPLAGGSALAERRALAEGRPLRVVDPAGSAAAGEVVAWLRGAEVAVLHVAGPRESEAPGIGDEARTFLARVLSALARDLPAG